MEKSIPFKSRFRDYFLTQSFIGLFLPNFIMYFLCFLLVLWIFRSSFEESHLYSDKVLLFWLLFFFYYACVSAVRLMALILHKVTGHGSDAYSDLVFKDEGLYSKSNNVVYEMMWNDVKYYFVLGSHVFVKFKRFLFHVSKFNVAPEDYDLILNKVKESGPRVNVFKFLGLFVALILISIFLSAYLG